MALNEFIFPRLEPVPVPKTRTEQFLKAINIFTDQKRNAKQQIYVPQGITSQSGYFRVKRITYGAELEQVAPGAILRASTTVLAITYNEEYLLPLEVMQMRKGTDARFEISSTIDFYTVRIAFGFSSAAMSELLNRWVCACTLGHVVTLPFAINLRFPSLEAFKGYAPDPVRDGISFERVNSSRCEI